MKFSHLTSPPRGWFRAVLSVSVLLGAFQVAQATETTCTALSWIPQEAVLYHAWFRNREQLDAVAASRAWARLKELPACREGVQLLNSPEAKLAWQLLRSHWDRLDTTVAQGQVLLEDPQIRRFFALLGDMFSDEVFVYGDETCLDTARLLRRIAEKARNRPESLPWSAETGTFDEKEQMVGSPILEACAENLSLVHAPNLVFGFHLRDKSRAREQLGKIELLGHLLTWADPRWQGRLAKQAIGNTSFLVFSLDGTMLPEAALDGLRSWAPRGEDTEKLLARIRELPLVIAVGIRDDYLVLSLGESTDALARLDKAPRLVELPECKPLLEVSGEALLSVSYRDKTLQSVLAEPVAGTEESAPEPGAYVSFRLLVEKGIECYAHDYGQRPELDAMTSFRLLEHAGGRPILVVSLRSTFSGQRYDVLMDRLAEGANRLEEALAKKLSPAYRETFQKTTAAAGPLANYLRHVLRGMLAMALADGQALIVLDADATTTTRWQTLHGEARPMPLPEPAVVLDTTGMNHVRQVLAEGRRLILSLLATVGLSDPPAMEPTETQPGNTPGPPKFYSLGNWEAPSFGLAESEAVVSFSPNHTARLLEPGPLKIGLFTDNPRQRVLAYAFDTAGLIEALEPWINVGARRLAGDTSDAWRETVANHLYTVLDVLSVLRTVSTEVYQDRGAWVTHTLFEIRDVE